MPSGSQNSDTLGFPKGQSGEVSAVLALHTVLCKPVLLTTGKGKACKWKWCSSSAVERLLQLRHLLKSLSL